MRDDFASAGDGPAPSQAFEAEGIPATAQLRAALENCVALMGDCARAAKDPDESAAAKLMAARCGARLATAAAQAGSALARLANAHADRRAAQINLAMAKRAQRRGQKIEKTTNNRLPRIWSP